MRPIARRSATDRIPAAVLVLLLWFWGTAGVAAPQYPPLTGRVVDKANLLSPQTRADLEQRLAAHERSTGGQIVIVTVPSLQGESIEEYGVGLGRHWGIGREGEDDGVLLIVAPNEREVRIEVGYGLEGTLTDALSSQILQNEILPHFRRGDFEAGIVAGTTALLRVLGGENGGPAPLTDGARPRSSLPEWLIPPIFFGVWLLLVLFLRRQGRRYGGPLMGPGGVGLGRRGGFSRGGGGFSGRGGSFGGGGATGRW